jgi:hypothetical protein
MSCLITNRYPTSHGTLLALILHLFCNILKSNLSISGVEQMITWSLDLCLIYLGNKLIVSINNPLWRLPCWRVMASQCVSWPLTPPPALPSPFTRRMFRCAILVCITSVALSYIFLGKTARSFLYSLKHVGVQQPVKHPAEFHLICGIHAVLETGSHQSMNILDEPFWAIWGSLYDLKVLGIFIQAGGTWDASNAG